ERRVEEQTRDLTDAQEQLRDALERERESIRELLEITATVPGAVFRLRHTPDGTASLPFVSEGVAVLCDGERDSPSGGSADPRRIARMIAERVHPEDRAAARRALMTLGRTLQPWRAQ